MDTTEVGMEPNYLIITMGGGFNDILSGIMRGQELAAISNRQLAIDTEDSCYSFNFSDFFSLKNTIGDSAKIKELKKQLNPGAPRQYLSPHELENPNSTQGRIVVKYLQGCCSQKDKTHQLFNRLIPCEDLLSYCREKRAQLKKPYITLQIRHTDLRSNPEAFYNAHSKLIHRYNEVHLATDSPEVVDFFKKKVPNIKNFSTLSGPRAGLPDGRTAFHQWGATDGHTQLRDLICDLLLGASADRVVAAPIVGNRTPLTGKQGKPIAELPTLKVVEAHPNGGIQPALQLTFSGFSNLMTNLNVTYKEKYTQLLAPPKK